jgi:hypothetical protein
LANYGELVAIAGRTGRKRDWAEAFFLSNKTSPENEDDQQDDSDAPDEAQDG